MFPVIENLRAFFNSRPPLVVFMICLASFAIALMTFAYIVKTKERIPDSDVTEDWNSFLEKFSKIDFCFPQNASDITLLNSTGGKLVTGDLSPSEMYHALREKINQLDLYETFKLHKLAERDVQSSSKPERASSITRSRGSTSSTSRPSPTSDSGHVQFRNVSFTLNVEVVLSPSKMPRIPWSETRFVTIVKGAALKLEGELADAEVLATFTFPNDLGKGTCDLWDKGVCVRHIVLACLQLQGPASMFPDTQMAKQIDMCALHQQHMSNPGLRVMVETLPGASKKMKVCQEESHMSINFDFDESLTVLLSLHDRSVINLRLMRTSYFLFVMVITFLCYAMVKGKRTKNKAAHIPYVEKVPL